MSNYSNVTVQGLMAEQQKNQRAIKIKKRIINKPKIKK